MELTSTQHGLKWDDMELTCLCEDNKGRVFIKVERGGRKYEVYVTKTGKLVVNEIK